ncbi:TPA: dihydropteroate synthase [Candidatus Poribacteria bacterium]|nr:dihydropteroate synthase [Candidatus Poribacteria bacterium]
MILIGENINIMSRKISRAVKKRDKKVIQDLALKLAENGMDYLDLNIGPARKQGPELMKWMVETVHEVVDLPLFLDTTNVEAIRAGLETCEKGTPVINSISCRPDRMEALFPLVKEFDVPFVGLLLGVEGVPRDAGERGILLADFVAKAGEEDIPPDRIWVDPIILPVTSQQNQVKEVVDFMNMFDELGLGCLSTCGLSNVSNGAPSELRPILNRTYLIMLKRYGMYSAIVDGLDEELIRIARGEREDIEKLVHRAMDGEEIDLSTLSEEEVNYVKTTNVLMGRSLYSHSWLRI